MSKYSSCQNKEAPEILVKPLNIICLPSEIEMEFTHTDGAPDGKIEWG